MKASTCPACAEAVAPGATKCPHCGEALRGPGGQAARWVGRSLVLPAAAILPAAACLLCGAADGAAAVLPRRVSFFVPAGGGALAGASRVVVRSLPLCRACDRGLTRRRRAASVVVVAAVGGATLLVVGGAPFVLQATAPRAVDALATLLVVLVVWVGGLLGLGAYMRRRPAVRCTLAAGADAWLEFEDADVPRAALGPAVPDRHPPGPAVPDGPPGDA